MKRRFLMLLVLASCAIPCHAEWFDEATIDSVVLIETRRGPDIVPHGTGLLFRKHPSSTVLVVTAGHLLGADTLFVSLTADSAFVAFAANYYNGVTDSEGRRWTISGTKLRTAVGMKNSGQALHKLSPECDLGAFPISLPGKAQVDSLLIRIARARVVTPSFLADDLDLSLGNDAYFLGFPAGLGSQEPILPVLRKGAIAWLNPSGVEFLIDAVSLGGNSGSPVFTFARFTERLRIAPSRLVGIVVGHHGDRRILLQQDPKNRQVAMTQLEIENFGLARAIMASAIIRLADMFEEQN